MLTVAWLISRPPLLGGEFLRATVPARLACDAHGWATAVCDRMGSDDHDGPLVFLTPGPEPRYVLPDVIIVRPIREWRPEYTEQARRAGQVVIADLDDDVWAHEDWTPETRPNDDHYDDWFWGVDGCLASTSVIAHRVRSGVGARTFAGPVVVAPNCFESDLLAAGGVTRPGTRRVGTRLWLSGRQSADLQLYSEMAPVLAKLGYTMVHVGADERPDASGRPRSFRSWGFEAEAVEEHPSTAEPFLGKVLSTCSAGLICVGDAPYNRAKTLTHPLELALIGLPLILASDLPIYRHVPGLVAPRPDAVAERLRALEDPAIWRREQARVVEWARYRVEVDRRRYLSALWSLVRQTARSRVAGMISAGGTLR